MTKNIRILDCTLRDGGRIIDCAFPDGEIKDMVDRLAVAKIDIVEVGFLRDRRKVSYKGDSTFFTEVGQIAPFLDKSRKNVMYVAFIDYGLFDIESLAPRDGSSIDGIRLGFTKKDYENNRADVRYWMDCIKAKGYELFIQGVNSLNYSDREFLDIVDMVNDVHPYSFGIVDTYGAMYAEDVDRLYGLVDRNMLEDICINFHSHNNYQLSFSLAQEVIRLSASGSRKVIVDATVGGMGKVAGNLNTELIVDYLVRRMHYDYELDGILDIYDDYIYRYSLKHQWGYSIPAMMAGIYKSHPNNVIYLTEKFRLDSKDIGKILSMIDPATRQRYDYDNIERLYIEYVSDNMDDSASLKKLSDEIGGRQVVVLVPGNSLNTMRCEIDDYIASHDAFVVSVNFVADDPCAYAFFGNQKRYNKLKARRNGRHVIVSSNVRSDQNDIVVNYHALIDRGFKYFENSTLMLLNLLRRLDVEHVAIAGFDGFQKDLASNYSDDSFQNDRHVDEFEDLNREIAQMLSLLSERISGKCSISFITPSRFEKAVRRRS